MMQLLDEYRPHVNTPADSTEDKHVFIFPHAPHAQAVGALRGARDQSESTERALRAAERQLGELELAAPKVGAGGMMERQEISE